MIISVLKMMQLTMKSLHFPNVIPSMLLTQLVSASHNSFDLNNVQVSRYPYYYYYYLAGKKLARGISRATDNVNLVNKARCELGLDFRENNVCNVNQYFIETPVFTFTLPDLSIYPGMQNFSLCIFLNKFKNCFLIF